jgi:phosphoserine phosphatase RsbU/P
MNILIAEDDPSSARLLEFYLQRWGHSVVVARDGLEAWEVLSEEGGPQLAVLDWMMPGMDGVELCRRARSQESTRHLYVILLTARSQNDDVVEGLSAGADDYMVKPFRSSELRARIQAGVRIVELQASLQRKVAELEEALAQVQQLEGVLPICSYCQRIRNDEDYWQQLEAYISSRTDASFSHGICPECWESRVEPELRALQQKADEKRAPVCCGHSSSG